ncbi:hypothetical protein KA005_21765 [bacterium]|nr:hypothetical protein [bacterium]
MQERHARKLILRGYVRPKRDYYLAVCIDLNLVAQGRTVHEALESLKEAMEGYLEEIDANPEFYKETIPRKSPKSFYLQYYWACFLTFCGQVRVALKTHLRRKQEDTVCSKWCVEHYPVNYTGLRLA